MQSPPLALPHAGHADQFRQVRKDAWPSQRLRNAKISSTASHILFCLLTLLALGLGYEIRDYWWKFVPSSILIVATTYLFCREQSWGRLGIEASIRWVATVVVATAVAYLVAHATINLSLVDSGYTLAKGHIDSYLMVPFQTLNEELVFRALVISFLLKQGVSIWKSAFGVALAFSAVHLLFYYFNSANYADPLSIFALIVLFVFGFSLSLIYARCGSIAIPWALHCGWNFNQFGHSFVLSGNGSSAPANELEVFNLVTGSTPVVMMSLALLAFSVSPVAARLGVAGGKE